MIQHYLKVALRNLLKYKMQNIVSILGLALGFACFALAALWIHDEMTYDDFHQDAERIYMVRTHPNDGLRIVNNYTPYPLVGYLRENRPEIEEVCSTQPRHVKLYHNNTNERLLAACADSAFLAMFDIRLVKGSLNFLKPRNQEIAITEELAHRLFGEESPLGKEIELNQRSCPIGAVVTGWSRHSNLPYSILMSPDHRPSWQSDNEQIFIRLHKNTNVEAFEKQMNATCLSELNKEAEAATLILTPITELRYSNYLSADEANISFDYIFYFSIAGGLVILCSLFNYLTLFVSRLRMRGREMGLRKVNGATNPSLFVQLSIEFLLVLLVALIIGMVVVELSMPKFLAFTQLSETTDLYLETAGYLLLVIGVSFVFSQLPLYYFRRQTLNDAIRGKAPGVKRNLFRKSGIVLQLIISIGFIFCTVVMMKQLHFLQHIDVGMARHNRGNVALWMGGDINQWTDKIAALPMVTDVLPPRYFPLIPTGPMMYVEISGSDGAPIKTEEPVLVGMILSQEEFVEYYRLQLLEGEWLTEKHTANQVVINETAAKAMGWKQAVGKSFYSEYEGAREVYTVVGVVKDFNYRPPTAAMQPLALIATETHNYLWKRASILFQFKEGSWEACREAIEKMHKEDFPASHIRLFNEEEEYTKYLRSEQLLVKLLGIVSTICVVISIFGIFSLVTLSCEQRRKEIAVRKVNGATVKSILKLFFREYLLLLLIAAALAFPVAYLVMKAWLESYVRQTDISAGIYGTISAAILIIVFASIGWRVWKAARQNPAEVVKSEN